MAVFIGPPPYRSVLCFPCACIMMTQLFFFRQEDEKIYAFFYILRLIPPRTTSPALFSLTMRAESHTLNKKEKPDSMGSDQSEQE